MSKIARPFDDEEDRRLMQMILQGKRTPEICVALDRHKQVIRDRVLMRWQRPDLWDALTGKSAISKSDAPEAGLARSALDQDSLRAGHALTWDIITRGTTLHGVPFDGGLRQ